MSIIGLDRWIGRKLFVPAIIKLCQATRQSQFAVARLFWFTAALDGLYRAETLFASVLFGGLSVALMLTASLRADRPKASSMWFRMVALALLAIDLVRAAATGDWAGVEFWLFVLIAQYAATIRTIPPPQYESGYEASQSRPRLVGTRCRALDAGGEPRGISAFR